MSGAPNVTWGTRQSARCVGPRHENLDQESSLDELRIDEGARDASGPEFRDANSLRPEDAPEPKFLDVEILPPEKEVKRPRESRRLPD
jgi:hypothetical protein